MGGSSRSHLACKAMTFLAKVSSLSPSDLQTVLTTLSLDCGRSLWSITGLDVADADAQVILEAARAGLADLEGGSESPYEIDYSKSRSDMIAKTFWQRLNDALDRPIVEQLTRWSQHLLEARERDWFQGFLACFEILNDPLQGHSKLLLEGPDREQLLAIIASQLKNPSDRNTVDRCKNSPSDFDRELFVRMEGTGTPMDTLQQLLLRVRYEQLLNGVPRSLSARGSRTFLSWLQQRIRQLNHLADTATKN